MPALTIVAGPTAVGKTAHAIDLACSLGTEVLSCDSRQFYNELRIGVARPTDDELRAVRHHFVACRSVTDPYNIYDYERDAVCVAAELVERCGSAVAVGGSGLYVDALMHGVSAMPSPTPELRASLQAMSIEEKRSRLRLLDPDYYARVDLRNPVRLQRALEVCIAAGRPYSALLAESKPASRPFDVKLVVLELPPAELRARIDRRVDAMMAAGLADEVASLTPLRNLPTLRTVGYTELFAAIDGKCTVAEAVEAIKLNTWHYARKQMSWLRRYSRQS